MKVAVFIIVGVLLCGSYALVGAFAFGAGVRTAARNKLLEAGIKPSLAPLYARGAKLLNRLAQLTDLDGMYAGDVLSAETKRLVTAWVADYKKEIGKP